MLWCRKHMARDLRPVKINDSSNNEYNVKEG